MGTKPFIDIGLMVYDYHAFEKIYLYVPFPVYVDDVVDLSQVLMKKEIADLVFNDNCGTTHEPNGVDTYNREGDEKTILFSFEKNNDALKIENYGSGKHNDDWSFVEFDIGYYSDDPEIYGEWKKLYLRFRITSSHIEDELFCNLERKNQFLESGFEATRVVDIKFNMKRNIANEAIERMRRQNNQVVQMDKVHFLLIEPANNNVDSYGRDPKDCRKLEDEWKDYLWRDEKKGAGDKKEVGDLLAFHWRADSKGGKYVTEYAQMVRVTSAATNWKVISVYVLVAIALNIAASAIYECLGLLWAGIASVAAAICWHLANV